MYKIIVELSCYNCMNTRISSHGCFDGHPQKICKIGDINKSIDDHSEICKHYKLSKQAMEVWIGRAKLKEK